MSAPTRFPSGVTNAAPSAPLARIGLIDPTKWFVTFDDFITFDTGRYTVTTVEAGAGSASEAGQDTPAGGVVRFTNDDADNDSDFAQSSFENLSFTAGKKAFFSSRWRVLDATDCDVVMGIQIKDTTPLDVSDGVFFMKDDGDTNIDCYVEKDGTQTTETAIGTLVDSTWIDTAFVYDGKNEITFWIDGAKKATLATTNLPDDEELTTSFGIQNGAAAANWIEVDYIYAGYER